MDFRKILYEHNYNKKVYTLVAKLNNFMCCRCCQLVRQCEDHSPGEEDVAASVQREMEKMETAIRGAVERFTAMLENSRAKDTGTQLEVRLCA